MLHFFPSSEMLLHASCEFHTRKVHRVSVMLCFVVVVGRLLS